MGIQLSTEHRFFLLFLKKDFNFRVSPHAPARHQRTKSARHGARVALGLYVLGAVPAIVVSILRRHGRAPVAPPLADAIAQVVFTRE